jgi:glycosyltransferase involved in cell wall biosynthesis
MMLFSVLIANYNNSRFLGNALNSVLCQTYTNWEVILVDDASTDEFEEAIKPYVNDPRIKVYHNKKNHGCGYTKRRCAKNSGGAILGFLDPDDSLTPEAIKTMVDAHTANPACSLIYSTHYICDETLTIKRIADYTRPLPPDSSYLLIGDGSIHHFVSFKKQSYDQTEGISANNKKAVDQDLYYLLEEAGNVLFIPQPLYYYRIHPGAISNAGQGKKATIAHYTIIEQACRRRINSIRSANLPGAARLIKKYRTRYYKIRILNSFRKKKFAPFFFGLFIFPFAGGFRNLVNYCKKIPREGFGLIRRSLIDSNEIRP